MTFDTGSQGKGNLKARDTGMNKNRAADSSRGWHRIMLIDRIDFLFPMEGVHLPQKSPLALRQPEEDGEANVDQ